MRAFLCECLRGSSIAFMGISLIEEHFKHNYAGATISIGWAIWLWVAGSSSPTESTKGQS